MKEIKTTHPTLVALVDDEDFESVNEHTWHIMNNGYTQYAYMWNPYPNALMLYRFLLCADDEFVVDHVDRNGLNNQRSNIRLVSYSQNNQRTAKIMHRVNGTASSTYKGVQYDSLRRKWKVMIMKDYKAIYVGRFDDEISAALAYDRKAIELFGETAYTNLGRGRK